MKRLFPLILLPLLLSGCAREPQPATAQFFAMDTVMSATLYGEDAGPGLVALQQEVNRLEALWSRTRAESDISRLNAAAGENTWVDLAPDTAALLQTARDLGRDTGGALDVTIAPVMDAWGFGAADSFETSSFRVPSQTELNGLLPLVDGSGGLELDGNTAQLTRPGMAVDLGAVAKGATADHLSNLLAEDGVTSGLLDLGGNITALGTKPDGTPWKIGVKDPRDPEQYFCVLSLSDQTASTSGGYQRKFESGGQTYHHIIDPSTGTPAQTGLLSATAVSRNGTLADGLSTACFVLGADDAVAFWQDRGGAGDLDFDLVLVQDSGTVLITEGLEEGLGLGEEEVGYSYEIIRR